MSTAPLGWLELRASAELRAAGVFARLVDVALSGMNVDSSLCHDASLAVAELVANVHEHEPLGAAGEVRVRLLRETNALVLEVESEGPAFDLKAALAAAAGRDIELDLRSGGLGLRLVSALFDRVEGLREGETNRTRLTKHLP